MKFSRPMAYWTMGEVKREPVWMETPREKQRYEAVHGDISTDVLIIGGGITGILTAFQLHRAGVDCVLVEKQHVVTESSGYTTALISRSPDIVYRQTIKAFTLSRVKDLLDQMKGAQQLLRSLATEQQIACDWTDCSSFYYSNDLSDDAKRECEGIAETTHAELLPSAGLRRASECAQFDVRLAVRFPAEAHFHPRKFLVGILECDSARGLRVFENSEVKALECHPRGVTARLEQATIRAHRVVLAGRTKILPALEQHFIKKKTFLIVVRFPNGVPFSDDLYWDNAVPYHYFRRINDHEALVGGADTDTSNEAIKADAFDKLTRFARERWPDYPFEKTHQWQGTIFETKDQLPYIGQHPEQPLIYAAQGYAGCGMVLGALASRMLSAILQGQQPPLKNLLSFGR